MKPPHVLLASIMLALALGLVAPAAAGPRMPSFSAVKSYAIGKGSGAITVADLNGDGKPDVAAPHSRASTVSVTLNRGDGRFDAPVAYQTAPQPADLAARDLNADGKTDLVTANNTGISVLLNRVNGTFGARTDFPGGGDSLAIVELNGDAYPDIVLTSGVAVSVFLNRGDGSYEARQDYPIGGDYIHAPEVADLNGDNRPDIVTTNTDKSLSVRLNDGNGGFGARRDYRTGGAYDAVASRDLNGDGYPDLITYTSGDVSETYDASVFLNRGDGSFAPRRAYDIVWHLVDLVDVNADERPDLVSEDWDVPPCDCGEPSGFYVRLNRGDGSFRGLRFYRLRAINAEEGPQGRLADLNGDGKPELIVTHGFRGAKCGRTYPLTSISFNRGGRFQPQVDFPTCGVTGIDVADVNGDARPDVLTSGASAISVLMNSPGLCNVQDVVGMSPAVAKRTLARAHCRAGKVSRAYSKSVMRGRVISQKPAFAAVLPAGGKVKLVVSRGRKR
jgi:FG-GAP-like repeat/PASTA domain